MIQLNDYGVGYNYLSDGTKQADFAYITPETLEDIFREDSVDDDSKVLVAMLADTDIREDVLNRYELWEVYENIRDTEWYKPRFAIEILQSLGIA